jgi:hypothetical protein
VSAQTQILHACLRYARPAIGCALVVTGAFLLPGAGLLFPAVLLIAGGMRMARFKISDAQKQRDTQGLRDVCGACGHEQSETDPLVISEEGSRIHHSHYTDPSSGFCGRPYQQEAK